MNLPNKLTLLRIILTVFFVVFIFLPGISFKILALFIFSIAALTDLLDGMIAKSMNLITNFGKIMDPIADKILVLSAFLSFIQLQLIPAWIVIVIIARESAITSLRFLALYRGKVIPASKGGKYKTVSQMAAIFIILIFLILKELVKNDLYSYPSFNMIMSTTVYLAMLSTVTLTLISGISYVWDNRGLFMEFEDEKNSIFVSSIKLSSSLFYLGYSPFLPGTLASLAGLLVYMLFLKASPGMHLSIVLIMTCFGFWLSGEAEKILGKKDAREIIIDDFNGMLIGLLFLPYKPMLALAAFIIFRVMDGLKPYPINKIDKLPGSLGIMGDDILAGIYTNITLQLWIRFSSCSLS